MGEFAFVGLNKSGKTTALEAIDSFLPDQATSKLVGAGDKSGVPFKERVLRHLISNSNGDISVTATTRLEDGKKEKIIKALKAKHNIVIDPDSFDEEVTFEQQQRFKNDDFIKSYLEPRNNLKIKAGRQQKWSEPSTEERTKIRDIIYRFTFDITYFLTFIFDFPKRIFLTKERSIM